MFTQKELDLLKGFAKEISDYCWFPFDWRINGLRPTKSKLKYFLVFINFLFSLCHLVFITLRFSQRFGGGLTVASLPYHGFAFIIHILYFCFHIHMFIYTEEVAVLFNQLMYFHCMQGKHYLNMYVIPPNRREIIVRVLRRWINGAAITLFAIYAFRPNNVYFVYSLVPENQQNIWLQILFSPIEAYFVAYKVMIFHLFVVYFGLFYIATTNFWIQKICVEWSGSHEQQHHIVASFKLYRCLTVLNNLYNSSFASVIVPAFKSLIESGIVICTYGCIRLYKLPFQVFVMCPAMSSFLFIEQQIAVDWMAKVHTTSCQFRYNYSQNYLELGEEGDVRRTVAYADRFLRSCRPLRCHLTKVLFVEKTTRIVLLNMLLNQVVTLLVSDKQLQFS